MKAYTLVGPTNRYPCDFSSFASASACGVVVGTAATDRGDRTLSIAYERARAARLGEADLIARALSIVAWIFPRLRMIEGFSINRSTSRCFIAATLPTSKPRKARM